jgi:hypothetical protein
MMRLAAFKGMLSAALLAATVTAALADDVHAVKALPGYQCMVLANMWDGVGPQPPPVHVFAGPNPGAAQAGIAGGTLIVASPMKNIDGRTDMLFPDGRKVWVDIHDIAPFHVVSNPHATCVPVQLSNGRLGFQTKH